MHSKLANTGLTLLMVASIAACGSAPKPKAELALSNAAVINAEQAGAREHAAVELRQARQKNDAANHAYSKDNMATAKIMSEQALADAQLAQAKAHAEKSKVALKELRDGIETMRSEITRVQTN